MNGVILKPELNRRMVKAIELLCHKTGLASREIVQGGGLGSGGPLPPPYFDSAPLPRPVLKTLLPFPSPLGLPWYIIPGGSSAPAFPNHPCSFKAHPGFHFLRDLWLLCFWYNSVHI